MQYDLRHFIAKLSDKDIFDGKDEEFLNQIINFTGCFQTKNPNEILLFKFFVKSIVQFAYESKKIEYLNDLIPMIYKNTLIHFLFFELDLQSFYEINISDEAKTIIKEFLNYKNNKGQ